MKEFIISMLTPKIGRFLALLIVVLLSAIFSILQESLIELLIGAVGSIVATLILIFFNRNGISIASKLYVNEKGQLEIAIRNNRWFSQYEIIKAKAEVCNKQGSEDSFGVQKVFNHLGLIHPWHVKKFNVSLHTKNNVPIFSNEQSLRIRITCKSLFSGDEFTITRFYAQQDITASEYRKNSIKIKHVSKSEKLKILELTRKRLEQETSQR